MRGTNESDSVTAIDESAADSDQESRVKRYDQRIEEWLSSLKEGAEQRSPEVLGALATKAKDVGDYLDKLAEKARSRNEASETAQDTAGTHGERGYSGPDPESDPKGDRDHEDQGT